MEVKLGILSSGVDLAHVKLFGMVDGDARVSRDSALIAGTIVGNLVIDEKADVIVTGTIIGNIINYGSLCLSGVVNGDVKNSPTAKYCATEGSKVRNLKDNEIL